VATCAGVLAWIRADTDDTEISGREGDSKQRSASYEPSSSDSVLLILLESVRLSTTEDGAERC